MNEQLLKAYELIKEEQRNADNKANIFVVLLTAFLSFFDEIKINSYSLQQIEGMRFIYLSVTIPLLLLVVSLIPIYKHTYIRINKKNEDIEFNIFFWGSISNLDNSEELYKKYVDTYKLSNKLSNEEKHLLDQIKVNAEIMERKTFLHKRAFFIIGQLILIFLVSVIIYFTFQDSLVAFAITFIFLETVFLVGIFNKPKFLFRIFKRISDRF